MSPGRHSERVRRTLRLATLGLLAAAPLALGSVHEPAFIPLLIGAYSVGLVSWGRGHWARARGAEVARVPGRRLLVALHAVVLLQLLPLPPGLLRLVSPGSFSFYNDASLVPLREWRPISVGPVDTARGLAFLGGMSLLYAAVFREFTETRWRRRLAGTVVATGFVMTLVALLQAASGEPKIYGLWRPRYDWAVFGPYVNRNHFAGYMVMAIPLALAFAAEAVQALSGSWRRRRAGWTALGEAEGNAAIRRSAEAMVLVVGLLASQSRAGVVAFVVSAAALPLSLRHRRSATLVIALVALLGVSWVGLSGVVKGFETRGVRASRLELWADALRLVPDFPVLGAGFNAFGTAYPAHQTIWKSVWFGEAHNEYLQALVDTGLVGAALVLALLFLLFRAAVRAAPEGSLAAGLLGSLIAAAVSNSVDFNWQIPANAATFAALAGCAVRSNLDPHLRHA